MGYRENELTSVLWAEIGSVSVQNPVGPLYRTTFQTELVVIVIFLCEVHRRVKMHQFAICLGPVFHVGHAADEDGFTCAYFFEIEGFSSFVCRYLLQAC